MRRWLCLVPLGFVFLGGGTFAQESFLSVERKLQKIVIPEITIDHKPLAEALDLVSAKAKEFDKTGVEEKGVRIGYDRQRLGEEKRLVLIEEKGATLGKVLELISQQVGRDLIVYQDGVVIARRPEWKGLPELAEGELGTITLRVPADFERFLESASGAVVDDDPFAAVQPRELTVQGYFENQGISFGDGCWARYVPRSNAVVVRNNRSNLELVDVALHFHEHDPNVLLVSAEVFSVPPELAHQLSRRAAAGEVGASLLRRVDRSIAAGEGQLVASPTVRAVSGQHGRAANGESFRMAKEIKVEGGVAAVEFGDELLGTNLHVLPVLLSDRETIELNLELEIALGEPVFKKQKTSLPAGGEFEIEIPQSKAAKLLVTTTLTDGRPHFGGVLAGREAGETLVAFLTATVVYPEFELPEGATE